jgi:hypothetical protein
VPLQVQQQKKLADLICLLFSDQHMCIAHECMPGLAGNCSLRALAQLLTCVLQDDTLKQVHNELTYRQATHVRVQSQQQRPSSKRSK